MCSQHIQKAKALARIVHKFLVGMRRLPKYAERDVTDVLSAA